MPLPFLKERVYRVKKDSPTQLLECQSNCANIWKLLPAPLRALLPSTLQHSILLQAIIKVPSAGKQPLQMRHPKMLAAMQQLYLALKWKEPWRAFQRNYLDELNGDLA